MRKVLVVLIMVLSSISFMLKAQDNPNENRTLGFKQQSLIGIAASTAKGDLSKLRNELNAGLEAGLSVNQIKEALVHLYAYAGFPRSIRGLQTFMAVMDERKARGVNDVIGTEASQVYDGSSRYERGKAILEELTGVSEDEPKTGYAAFAPQIEVFLKEHLFADIFERDILTYKERELVTISVLSSIGGVEPMLHSHLNICLNVGLTPEQLQQFIGVIKQTIGKKEATVAKQVVDEVLKSKKSLGARTKQPLMDGPGQPRTDTQLFVKGQKITNDNFTGIAWLNPLVDADSANQIAVGSVTFEPLARTKWHSHPAGQIILALEGIGYYQEKGGPKIILKKGDVVRCPPDTPHWHGASADTSFVQVAITGREKGETAWLEEVTEQEYKSFGNKSSAVTTEEVQKIHPIDTR